MRHPVSMRQAKYFSSRKNVEDPSQKRQVESRTELYLSHFIILLILTFSFNICHHHHHHHHVVPPARISLTLSRHFSLSFITSGRSSELNPVSSQSYCMYVRAGRPAFARPYMGVHRSTSLMSSSLLLQQCPACLVTPQIIFFQHSSTEQLQPDIRSDRMLLKLNTPLY